jgi:hypothetical protein
VLAPGAVVSVGRPVSLDAYRKVIHQNFNYPAAQQHSQEISKTLYYCIF